MDKQNNPNTLGSGEECIMVLCCAWLAFDTRTMRLHRDAGYDMKGWQANGAWLKKPGTVAG